MAWPQDGLMSGKMLDNAGWTRQQICKPIKRLHVQGMRLAMCQAAELATTQPKGHTQALTAALYTDKFDAGRGGDCRPRHPLVMLVGLTGHQHTVPRNGELVPCGKETAA